ncbi:MAG: lytic transglycosylase domain-containing protein [Bdellovibrionota bacterium]
MEINFAPLKPKNPSRLRSIFAHPRLNQGLLAIAIVASLTSVVLSAMTYFRGQHSLAPLATNDPAALSAPPAAQLTSPPSRVLDGNDLDSYVANLIGETKVEGELVVGLPVFDREAVLDDHQERIDDTFAIQANMRERAGFWFDVYTKYDANRRIIHHTRFPWIIYKVVDVTPIIEAPTPKFRWMRNMKADAFVKKETDKILAAIRTLAKGKSEKQMNETELVVAEALSKLGGVKKQARLAIGETRVQMGQRNFFRSGLEVSNRYLSAMERIFRAQKLPTELTRIPFVESSFNKHATSKVGASGIWQFMGNTGRKFMIVNDSIDERRSPFKATEAAARLLKENHLILSRKWPLAVTAWNHGPAGIRRASKAAGSKDLGEIISRYNSRTFDFASSNFYSEFLGALYAEKYQNEIFGDLQREATLDVQVVRVPRSIRASEIIRVSGLSEDEFLALNPELQLGLKTRIPAGFRLHIPAHVSGEVERLLAARDSRPIKKS